VFFVYMARAYNKEEISEIERVLLDAGTPVSEIAEYRRKAEKYDPNKVEKLKGINPEQISSIQAEREKIAKSKFFR
jgi:hypothetical protein